MGDFNRTDKAEEAEGAVVDASSADETTYSRIPASAVSLCRTPGHPGWSPSRRFTYIYIYIYERVSFLVARDAFSINHNSRLTHALGTFRRSPRGADKYSLNIIEEKNTT